MKLTTKSIQYETTKTVCEITQDEFDKICAETAASIVVGFIGEDPDIEDLGAGLSLTKMFADFVSKLDERLFNDKNENPNKKEEK